MIVNFNPETKRILILKRLKKNIVYFINKLAPNLLFLRKKEIDPQKVQKILINSLYFIGDTIFHTPLFEAMRYKFPNATIDLWTKSRNYEVVKNNPCFNQIIIFDDVKTAVYNEKVSPELSKKLKFVRKIRKKNYDLYIDLTGKYTTAIFALIGKFKYSAGINYHGFGFCYNKFYNINTSNDEGHLIDKYLSIIKYIFNINDSDWANLLKEIKASPYLYVDNESKEIVDEELKRRNITGERPLVCFHTTAGWKAKELDSEIFASLIEEFIESGKYDLLIVGADSDYPKLREIQSFIKGSVNIVDIFISLSLNGTIELISRADLLIGSDSAPLHIAGAVNTPSIGLFGPTNPEFSKPRGKNHMVVYHNLYCSASNHEQFCTRNAGWTCPTIDCMKNITMKEIFNKTETILSAIYKHT